MAEIVSAIKTIELKFTSGLNLIHHKTVKPHWSIGGSNQWVDIKIVETVKPEYLDNSKLFLSNEELEEFQMKVAEQTQKYFQEMNKQLIYGFDIGTMGGTDATCSKDVIVNQTVEVPYFSNNANYKISVPAKKHSKSIGGMAYVYNWNKYSNRSEWRESKFARRTKTDGWNTPRIQGRNKCHHFQKSCTNYRTKQCSYHSKS